MKKILLILFLLLSLITKSYAVDTGVSSFVSILPTSDDLLYVVDNPGGTPVSRKSSLFNLFLNSSGLFSSINDESGSGVLMGNNGATMTSPTINTTFTFSAGSSVMTGAVGGIQISGDSNVTGRLHKSGTDYLLNTRTINTTSPLTGGGSLSADRTFAIGDAAADGATKGAASFNANDFDSSSGNISTDYTNGQEATSSQDGFLSSTDWSTFNNKLGSITASSPLGVSGGSNVYVKDSTGTLSLVRNSAPTMTSPTVNTSFTFTSMMTGNTSGIEVTPDIQLDKNVRFNQYNCSGYSNGGKLTVDGLGSVICSDDNNSGGSSITASDPLNAVGNNVFVSNFSGSAGLVRINAPTITSPTVKTSLIVEETGGTDIMTAQSAGVKITGGLQITTLNCNGANGGAVTTDTSGNLVCSDDNSTSVTISASDPLASNNGNIYISSFTGTYPSPVVLNNTPTMTSPTMNTSFTATNMISGVTGGVSILTNANFNNLIKTPLNCTSKTNGGVVTADANGFLSCDNDDTAAVTISGVSPLAATGGGAVYIKDSTGTSSVVLNNAPIMTSATSQTLFTIEEAGGTNIFTGQTGGVEVTGDAKISGVLNCVGCVGTEDVATNTLLDTNIKQTQDVRVASLHFEIDGGGSVITTGAKSWIRVPYNMVITGWTVTTDLSGSIVVDLWKDTYANYPPTVADTITGSDLPTVTTATKNTSTALTGWNTSVAAGEIIKSNVNSATTVTKVGVDIHGYKP